MNESIRKKLDMTLTLLVNVNNNLRKISLNVIFS